MYQLIRTNVADTWVIVFRSDNSIETGPLDECVDLLHRCGVPMEEIAFCMQEMRAKGHNRAHFGINCTFVFSDVIKLPATSAA
jgi:hypothetical protein